MPGDELGALDIALSLLYSALLLALMVASYLMLWRRKTPS
jgi:hypothetical protein